MKLRSLLFSAAALGISVMPMLGGAITPDNGSTYHEFFFGAATSAAGSCGGTCTATTNPVADQSIAPPWTFSGPASVFVLDFGHIGDRFEIFDNGGSLGMTSNVTNTGLDPCGLDITCALGNAGYSRGTFAFVGAGPHSLTINVIQNFSGCATAGPGGTNNCFGNDVFSATSTAGVPEPGAVTLMGAGLLGLAFLRRRIV